jgi:hypothetical protein
MSASRDASDTTARLKNRVLFADRVIQTQAFENGLKKVIRVQGGDPVNGGTDYTNIYYPVEAGETQTTTAELATYVESVPSSLPNPPTNVIANAYNGYAYITFIPPSYTGTSPITSYTVISTPGNIQATGTGSGIVVPGLTNGTAYSFTVYASSLVGNSRESLASTSVTPSATIVSFTTVETTTWTAPDGVQSVEYLIVGGGGGGGGAHDNGGGGGGGGGMFLLGSTVVMGGEIYTVQVGAGGAASTNTYPDVRETNGGAGDSSIFGTITATGGDGGSRSRSAPAGSGLGGAAQISTTTSARGGNGGGAGNGAGGGGGSSGTGSNRSGTTGGAGGAGTATAFSGMNITYATGGSGGSSGSFVNGTSGTASRGDGGTGAGASSGGARNGGAGGSGIVIIKY